MRAIRLAFAVVAATLFAAAAQAHTFGAAGAGFAQGIAHPLGGIDHVLAMVAVGLWAAQLGGRALWLVPASFVGVMALGGLAGASGLPLPAVETGITGSLVVLGALVAARSMLPAWTACAIVGLFALFHGHAHGTEMPAAGSAVLYGLGFVTATALLHGAGMAAGVLARGRAMPALALRAGGGAVAILGLVLLAQPL